MSLYVSIQCDECGSEIHIDDADFIEYELGLNDWEEDPNICDRHYCPSCWKKVKQQMTIPDEEE